jgi:hypothetical protein
VYLNHVRQELLSWQPEVTQDRLLLLTADWSVAVKLHKQLASTCMLPEWHGREADRATIAKAVDQ